MESGHIQVPFGFVPDQNPDNDLYFHLPLNYKKNLLFNKLSYIAQLNNPAIDDVVRGKKTDDISIQKFLLATGLLQDTIQGDLDMIVTDGDFNDASVRRALDTKFPAVMKKPTATNFMFIIIFFFFEIRQSLIFKILLLECYMDNFLPINKKKKKKN